jgi:hypothetical protein
VRSLARVFVSALALVFGPALAAVACNDGTAVTDQAFQPQIVTVQGPPNGVVTCDPTTVGGVCPFGISVTFRLPKAQYVWKAYVRFHGDGSDTGVDRGYLLESVAADAGADSGAGAIADAGADVDAGAPAVGSPTVFGNDATPVTVSFEASIPPTILRKGALFTYEVRLVSGNGVESQASTLTVSVQ